MFTLPFLVRPATLALLFGLVVSACGSDNTKLLVTGIEPDRGDTDGDTYVRIKGNRFMADGPRTAKIYFGGRPGRVVRFESDAELVVQPPGGKAGEVVDVLIMFEPGGTLKIPNGFRYYERNRGAPSVDDLNISRGKDGKK
jgi:hypothetical protein